MSEYEHESHNRILLPNGFNVMQDEGQEILLQGSRVTIYGEAGVNVYVQDAALGGKGEKGTLVVDRGVVLMQRSKYSNNGGMLSISAFGRDKKDDSMPDVVIPVPFEKQLPCQRRAHDRNCPFLRHQDGNGAHGHYCADECCWDDYVHVASSQSEGEVAQAGKY